MKFKTIIIILVAVLFLLTILISWQLIPQLQSVTSQLKQFSDHQIITIKLGDQILHVEVVNTPASITRGLSGRDEIGVYPTASTKGGQAGQADGMIFVLPQRTVPRFWMREMQFDLDFVWLDRDRVVALTENVPAPLPETPLTELPNYSPGLPAELVLELPAGKIQELGVEIQDSVDVTSL